jgi:hypothetical protein
MNSLQREMPEGECDAVRLDLGRLETGKGRKRKPSAERALKLRVRDDADGRGGIPLHGIRSKGLRLFRRLWIDRRYGG